MAVRVQSALLAVDGFDVVGVDGSLGTVEEHWVGEHDEPAALVVRLADGQRALLQASEVTAIDLDASQVHVATSAHMLHLEWRPAHVPAPRVRSTPVVRTIALMFGTLALIVCTLIGLDFLFAFLVGGGPPY